ncbi:hypothetical protein B2K_39120 [Paenibacillus mucilaginosus K02]|uniref:Uncharacterized protein n=1 Tax=Paenibacillus mucilaginosus K02 TaxID=997761 RepID=R9UN14_9BACL|nr:hypothetical protein B2K_39120 [Paenibacillus mucilaginosus K02]
MINMIGYAGPIVIEMEDLTLDPLTGVQKSMQLLQDALPRMFQRDGVSASGLTV